MHGLQQFVSDIVTLVTSNVDVSSLVKLIAVTFVSPICLYVLGLRIKDWWETHRLLRPDDVRTIREYLKGQVHAFPNVCEFRFDPDKDFVENTKRLITSQIPREYNRGIRHRLPFKRVLRHGDVIRLITQRRRGGFVYAIVGEPACGKTVEMVKIFAELARRWKPGAFLPVIIFVNSLPRSAFDQLCSGVDVNIEDIVGEYLGSSQPGATRVPSSFISLLRDRWHDLRPVLLFDAVDECPDKTRYENMVQALANAAKHLEKSVVIVISCREGDYSKRTSFVPIRILSLTQRQVVAHYRRMGLHYHRMVRTSLASIAHLEHYLTNVYFLRLYLDWAVHEAQGPVQAPASLSSLFEHMFVRELKKLAPTREIAAEAGQYLQDALAPVAYLLTLQAMPQPRTPDEVTEDFVGLAPSSQSLLAALAPQHQQAPFGWRECLWAYVQTRSPAKVTELGRLIATDQTLEKLIAEDPFPRECQVDTATGAVLHWINEFGFPIPHEEEANLRQGVSAVLQKSLPETRPFVGYQLALSFRALGWATKCAVLRVDASTGRILRFRHQRIREYLTARQIQNTAIQDFLERATVHNAWWRQTINMLAAVTDNPREVLLRVLGS